MTHRVNIADSCLSVVFVGPGRGPAPATSTSRVELLHLSAGEEMESTRAEARSPQSVVVPPCPQHGGTVRGESYPGILHGSIVPMMNHRMVSQPAVNKGGGSFLMLVTFDDVSYFGVLTRKFKSV